MVAAAIIGGAVISGIATTSAASSASSANRYGSNRAAQAQYDSTALQVGEARRQFDRQLEMLMPMIESQYGAMAFFANVLGFGGYNSDTGEFEGGGPQNMGFGAEGGFMDPNLSDQRFGYDNWMQSPLGEQVQGSLLAGATPEDDLAIRRAAETQFGANYADDPRYQRYLEQGDLVGNDFQTSPGYAFAVEEMQREQDRKNSAGGGNYGGRALIESQRRAKGLADQDYYNWLGQRRQDLDRGDRLTDVSVRDARRREELNVGRGDAALDSYFSRRGGDVSRLDDAVRYNDELGMGDRQRQDQGYYNFLNMIMGMANTGAVDSGVAASSRFSSAAGNAYGNQGNYLSSIWQRFGENEANIGIGEAAGLNNAVQGGISNWLYAQNAGLIGTGGGP